MNKQVEQLFQQRLGYYMGLELSELCYEAHYRHMFDQCMEQLQSNFHDHYNYKLGSFKHNLFQTLSWCSKCGQHSKDIFDHYEYCGVKPEHVRADTQYTQYQLQHFRKNNIID